MISKFIFSFFFLASIAQASSGVQPIQKAFTLYCQSDQGEMTLQFLPEQQELRIALVKGSETQLIQIDSIQALARQAKPSVRANYFSYDEPNLNFINIDGSFEKPVWISAHEECAPTRARACSQTRRVPGYWSSQTSNEVLVSLKPDFKGGYILSALRAEEEGIQGWHPIGTDVPCTGLSL